MEFAKTFITKLIDYFFTIIDSITSSFGNESLFTQQKENAPLIKHCGQIYIDFDEYPPYSGRISEIFEKNVNEDIQCVHGYTYSSGKHKMCTWVNEESWGIINTSFPDAKQIKMPKFFLCKECTYVQKDINESDENFDSTQYKEPILSSSFFMKDL